MRNFNYSDIEKLSWDNDIINLISYIRKSAVRHKNYLNSKPVELEKLIKIAKIQSISSSNAIEGIYTTDNRIRKLVNLKTNPKNRSEQEIAGYRDVLSIIHENYDSIPINSNYIMQLHKILYSYNNSSFAGKIKSTQNYITVMYSDGIEKIIFTPLQPFESLSALDNICTQYNIAIGKGTIDPLLIIPFFIHDFLCIHPFTDGNGRMSRLLTTMLLYKVDINIGIYISLETKIDKTKELYYSSLRKSQYGWHNEKENKIEFVKYILNIIASAYRDFEERMLVVESKSNLEAVEKIINSRIGKFYTNDISDICPHINRRYIISILNNFYKCGKLNKSREGNKVVYWR